MARFRICGVGIDAITKEAAVERSLAHVGEPTVVFTPNARMLEACRRDAALAELLSHASLSLPDGAGAVWAARRCGVRLPERVAGIDFGEALLERAARDGRRVFLLGGGAGVAERAAERLRERMPSLCICGFHWGYFDPMGEEHRMLLSRIRACRAEILLVCMGFPRQEAWIIENLGALSSLRVIAGLGGSMDVWAGDVHRAPRLVSRMGLEWAWRMLLQPRRMKELGALMRFALHSQRQRGERGSNDM